MKFLFLGAKKISSDSFSLKVNNTTKTFKSGTYLKFNLKESEGLTLNKGGFTGGTRKLKYEKEKLLFT
jgi:hypothetical protein